MPYVFNKEDFIKTYPQFSEVADSVFSFQLSFAKKIVNSYIPSCFDEETLKIATYYTLAYLLSMFAGNNIGLQASGSGVVTSASEGSVSVSMSIPKLANTWWGKNDFGVTALMFLRSFAKGGILIDGSLPSDITDV